MAVERPAPEVPMSNRKIRIGSRIIFKKPPDTRPIMAKKDMPS